MLGWGYWVAYEPDPMVLRNVRMLAVGRRSLGEVADVDYRLMLSGTDRGSEFAAIVEALPREEALRRVDATL